MTDPQTLRAKVNDALKHQRYSKATLPVDSLQAVLALLDDADAKDSQIDFLQQQVAVLEAAIRNALETGEDVQLIKAIKRKAKAEGVE